MDHKLSALNRNKIINHLAENQFDLLVIGGGITGAGIALDASSRGMKVALIEKNDFASGTSSKSTKLIHGGLRYLKQFEFDLVREVGHERAILHKNAPHLVHADNMLLPIVEGGSLGKITTNIGLTVYDWLAGVKLTEWKTMLGRVTTRKKEPLLRTDILKGGAMYKEYRTDDARLVIEVVKTAVKYDAYCLNYAKCIELLYEDGVVTGADVMDKIGNTRFSVFAKKVINAAGPWVEQLREMDHSLKGKRLHLTKGVHLVVDHERLPVKQSVYFDTPDNRMIFVIPRGDITYIGTTDTNFNGDIDHPHVEKKDVEYLLNAVNYMFPTVKLDLKDIKSTWAGLRPLIHEEGKSPSELSRKDEIFFSPTGLVSIAGGKLTGYRKMAQRAVDIISDQLESEQEMEFKNCFTDKITLSGGLFKDEYAIPEYIEFLSEEYKNLKIPVKQIKKLVEKYGSNTGMILSSMESNSDADTRKNLLEAELSYGIQEEMVTNLNDFLIRRTGMLYFERDTIEKEYPVFKHYIEHTLHWNEEQKKFYHELFMREFESVLTFK